MRTITEERIRVRYGETDQMGHAYYGNYALWLEQARGAYCRDRGFAYKDLEDMGYKLPVVEFHLRYRSEIKYDQMVVVQIWVEEIKRAAIKFAYKLKIDGEDAVGTEGYTWHVLVGPEMKAVTIPPHIREMLDRDPDAWDTRV